MAPTDVRTVLLIGSGPIQIGQAAEFDYSGAQACRALREEGVRVVLVNSNPATIMTDPEMADRVYVEPITTEVIAEVIRQEEPDGVIAGLGGQTGLNVTAELAEAGVLERYGVEVMGTPLETIYATEDRERFRRRMQAIDQPVPQSTTVGLEPDETVAGLDGERLRARVEAAVDAVGGLPVIARTTYTLGGSGSGVVDDLDELVERVRRGLRLSRNEEVLVTEAITDGWIELEYEVMRDASDSCIIICNMENLDPMGIHTGESIVVTPSQVVPDVGHQVMRDAALAVIRELGIQGGCNIQFAWRDDGSPGGEYRVVEVNPRVSRSSALASKATGYPIARVTAKVALGKRLHEIDNEITGETTAAFEPAIDYVVTKVPRWPAEKFEDVDFALGTAMKSTGEAMAIGRTFEESLLKALRSTEYEPAVDWSTVDEDALERDYLETPTPDRPYAMFEAFDRGYGVETVAELTGIHPWYVERYGRIADAATAAASGDLETPARTGFTNRAVAELANAADRDAALADGGGVTVDDVEAAVPGRSYKQVDTCAGEFAASTPYYYSARRPGAATGRVEVQADPDAESVVIVGAGPIRIGQGVEFDYCTVHAVEALREAGVEAHVVNNNPETVSTDYDTSDGLFFEPLSAEEIADVVAATAADGVMVQFGGQTSVNVGRALEAELDRRGLDCAVLGTTVDAMDLAENRDRFNALMDEIGVDQPAGGTATSEAEALDLADELGYPVLVRPSYVLGGRAMQVVGDDAELRHYLEAAVRVSPDHPVLVDAFLADAVEVDVDAVADGEDVFIGGIMEHVEAAGVHSGDSACAIPPPTLGRDVNRRIRRVTRDIARALDTVGLLNVQLAVQDDRVYVLEANPRASRTVPFVSKATGVPIAKLAARVMLGASLAELDAAERVPVNTSVKEVVLPFDRLSGADPRLGPEMKSTGEVMGTAATLGRAYGKAQQAVGKPVPTTGTAVIDLADDEFPAPTSVAGRALRERAAAHFDVVTFDDEAAFCDAIHAGEVDLIVSRARKPLAVAVEEDVTYFSTYPSALAALQSVEAADEPLDVRALSDRPAYHERWGQSKGT